MFLFYNSGSVFVLLNYFQIPLADHCNDMITFIRNFGILWLEMIPFGLMNDRATFEMRMNEIFKGLLFARVYLDDIVIISKRHSCHIVDMKTVFEQISASGKRLNFKCALLLVLEYGSLRTSFLGTDLHKDI